MKNFTIPSTQNDFEIESLVDVCRFRSRNQANKIAFRFLRNGIDESDTLTYRELDKAAERIALAIRSTFHNCERVVLIYPPGLDFIKVFFACLYAKFIAIPAYPVMSPVDSDRLKSILHDAKPSIILSSLDHLTSLKQWLQKENLSKNSTIHIWVNRAS